MGSRTDANLAAFQKEAGIKPATGERAEILRRLQDAAFAAIKIIELEMSKSVMVMAAGTVAMLSAGRSPISSACAIGLIRSTG